LLGLTFFGTVLEGVAEVGGTDTVTLGGGAISGADAEGIAPVDRGFEGSRVGDWGGRVEVGSAGKTSGAEDGNALGGGAPIDEAPIGWVSAG
jgi:hypothetical protein